MIKTLYALYRGSLLIGYLLGSVHSYLQPDEYKKVQERSAQILNSCTYLMLEAPLGEHRLLPLGVEKALLVAAEKQHKTITYFEDLWFQEALLSGVVWVGDKQVKLPWSSYDFMKKHPRLSYYLSKATRHPLLLYNKLYNFFSRKKHIKAVQHFLENQQQVTRDLIACYLDNKAFTLSEADRKRYLLSDRDANIAKIITTRSKKTSGVGLFAVGITHLTGEKGLITLLEKEGIVLIGLDFFDYDKKFSR